MNILETEHVVKSFSGREVLTDLSVSVPEHTIFGFVGKNGAGKTTAMKIILGLLKADSGKISVCSEEVKYGQTATNRFIGYLPDVPEFYSFMTPREYLNFCGEISGMTKKQCSQRTEEILATVGLANETHRIKGFSRGMKQRLGIAAALYNRPKLLICDEPTSALDPIGRKEILDILIKAKDETTVIFSTHILSDVERICDEISVLNGGKVVMSGTIDEIKSCHKGTEFEIETETGAGAEILCSCFPDSVRTDKTHLFFAPGTACTDIMQVLTNRNIPFIKLEKKEPSLEDLFMEVVGE